MAKVKIGSSERHRLGTVETEDGRPLFTLGVRSTAFGFDTEQKNHNIQRLNGRLVDLDSELRGRLAPGLASVRFGDEM